RVDFEHSNVRESLETLVVAIRRRAGFPGGECCYGTSAASRRNTRSRCDGPRRPWDGDGRPGLAGALPTSSLIEKLELFPPASRRTAETLSRNRPPRWHTASRVRHLRSRSRTRDCAWSFLRRVDVQRSSAGTDDPCDGR